MRMLHTFVGVWVVLKVGAVLVTGSDVLFAPVCAFNLSVPRRQDGLFLGPGFEVHEMRRVRGTVVQRSSPRHPSAYLCKLFLMARSEFCLR